MFRSPKTKEKEKELNNNNRDSMSVASTRSASTGNLTKSLSKATMILVGSGPPVYKQLKVAIMEGNEDKAISIYVSKEGAKIPLDKPFPTKKPENIQDTPIHLAAKYALARLLDLFIEYGGNPSLLNGRAETALHSTCLSATYPLKRAELIETILNWQLIRADNFLEKVDINAIDIDGNSALHLAAYYGMVQCLELLIRRGSRLNIINKLNLSPCESADRNGNIAVGTMLELAWLFQPTNELQLATQVYNKFSNETTGGYIFLDSRSIALTGLIDFINHAIRITAESLSETAARAEVLLGQYCWDVKKLKREYVTNADKVLRAAKLKQRPNAKKLGLPERETDTIRVGLQVEDIYCDPSYMKVQTFTVFKDGVKKSYSLQTYDNKVCVFPTGFDPSLRYMDDFNTNPQTSHIKPKKTELCSVCNEMMLESCSIIHYISGNIVEPFRREIRCSSGHKFCFNCWSDHAQTHHSLGCLPCPSADCGEILDLQWAPLILKRSELVNRLLTNRQQNVIKSLELKLCPAPNCGLLVRVLPHNAAKANKTTGAQRVVACANGHAFCLTCAHEAHSPLHCSELTIWQELLRQESKVAVVSNSNASKDKGSSAPKASSLFVSPPTSKRCPSCDAVIHKDEACNVVTCLQCSKKLCWTCMKEWSTHNIEGGNTMFYCNQFIEKLPKKLGSALSNKENGAGEEKVDDVAVIQKKQKLTRQNKIFHYFTRYMTHMLSAKLERDARKKNCIRILEGLRASQEGNLTWLRISMPNPLYEKSDDEYNLLPSIGTKEDALIADYQIQPDDSIEFLADAFDELEKSRVLLRWSYPFALFEFDDSKIIGKGKKASPNRTPQRLESFKVDYGILQASLEYNTELLSNFVAWKRIRATKQEISITTLTVRNKRIEFEKLIQEYLTPANMLGDELALLPAEESKKDVISVVSQPSNHSIHSQVSPSLVNNGVLSNNANMNQKAYRGGSNLSMFFAPNAVDTSTNTASPAQPPSSASSYTNTHLNSNRSTHSVLPPPAPVVNQHSMIPEPIEIVNVEQRIIAPKKEPDEEALEHAILLSKQEEEYGINMYDSLTPADEPLIAEYMDQGFTREESILIIYEEKFGKVSIQSRDIIPSLPSTIKSGGFHPMQDDPEVKTLMTRGYTKEQAIEIVMKKNQRRNPQGRGAGHGVGAGAPIPPNAAALFANPHTSEEDAVRSLVACGYTRDQAVAMFRESRGRDQRFIADDSYRRSELLAANEVQLNEPAVASWIARGYTREQAVHQVSLEQQHQRGASGRSHTNGAGLPPTAVYPPNASHGLQHGISNNNINRTLTNYDEDEIASMLARGFTREQAMQLTHRKVNLSVDTFDARTSDGFDGQLGNNYSNQHSSIYRASSLATSDPNYSSNYQPFNNNNSAVYPQEHHFPISPNTTGAIAGQRGTGSSGNTPTMPTHPNIFRAGGNPGGLGGNHSQYGINPEMPNYSGSVFETQSIAHSEYVMNPRQAMYDMNALNNYSRPSEANQMERTMLLMQQEAEFGINMYDSLTPADEPEINALIAQGYTYDDAVKMIFDRRYRPYDPKLAPVHSSNHSARYPSDYYNNNDQGTTNSSLQYSNDSNYSGFQEDKRYSRDRNDSRGGFGSSNDLRTASGAQGKKKVFRGSHMLGLSSNSGPLPDEDPYARTLRISQSETTHLPRPVSGIMSNNNGGRQQLKYKASDVKQLEKMGFTKEQAVQALVENDNDLHRAADMLLSLR